MSLQKFYPKSVRDVQVAAPALQGKKVEIYGFLVILDQSYITEENVYVEAYEGAILQMDGPPEEMGVLVDRDSYIPSYLFLVMDNDFSMFVAENCPQPPTLGSDYIFRSPASMKCTLEENREIDPEVTHVLTSVTYCYLNAGSVEDFYENGAVAFQNGIWEKL